MKRHINSTIFCFYLSCDLYAEMDFGVHMIRTYLTVSLNSGVLESPGISFCSICTNPFKFPVLGALIHFFCY